MMFPREFGTMPPAIPARPMPQSCIHSQPLHGCRFVTFGRRTGRHVPSRNTSALTLRLFGSWTAWLAAELLVVSMAAATMFFAKERRRYTASEVRKALASSKQLPPPRDLKDKDNKDKFIPQLAASMEAASYLEDHPIL